MCVCDDRNEGVNAIKRAVEIAAAKLVELNSITVFVFSFSPVYLCGEKFSVLFNQSKLDEYILWYRHFMFLHFFFLLEVENLTFCFKFLVLACYYLAFYGLELYLYFLFCIVMHIQFLNFANTDVEIWQEELSQKV